MIIFSKPNKTASRQWITVHLLPQPEHRGGLALGGLRFILTSCYIFIFQGELGHKEIFIYCEFTT